MPEPLASPEKQRVNSIIENPGEYVAISRSVPTQAYNVPESIQAERESLFHPVKAINDILKHLDNIAEKLELVNNNLISNRSFEDTAIRISATTSYTLDYKGKSLVYARSDTAQTLAYPSGTISLAAGVWTNISFERGTEFTVTAATSPVVIRIRHCNFFMG